MIIKMYAPRPFFRPLRQFCAIGLVCWLSMACETKPKPTPTPVQKTVLKAVKATQAPAAPTVTPSATPVPPAPNADAQAFKEGVALYNEGDYNGAIKKLTGASAIWNGRGSRTRRGRCCFARPFLTPSMRPPAWRTMRGPDGSCPR